jgi:SAM-dependent methyltransferase
MSIYTSQNQFFEAAYRTGEHGWPVSEPSAPVVNFVRQHRKPARVLDIGCGEGRHALLFAKRGHQTVALDNQPQAITRAIQINNAVSPHLRFVLGDVFHLPFSPNTFDVVLDYGCFHHVRKQDEKRYLQGVLPLLKSGGHFLLCCFSTRFKHWPGEQRSRDWLVHRGHYDRFFKKGSFKTIFGAAFELLSIEEERQDIHAFYHVLMRKR